MATKKQKADEFRELLENYLLENGDRVRELLEESRVRAVNASWKAETQARLALEEQWYGPKQEPEPPRRAIATASFTHGDLTVKIGDVYSTDDLVVAQVNHCFVIAED